VNITSDAITTVSVTDSRSAAAATVNILNSGATGANSGAINYVLSNVGSTTARVTLSDAPATSVNISSGSASTFTGARNTDSGSFVTITSPAATSITLTNTLPVDLGDVLATAGKVATVNGANATGGISAILASTPNQGMAVTTGSGADTVTLKASATIASVLVNGNTVTTSINLGAGNDRLLDQGNKDAGTSATVGVGAVIDAGAGTDTVSASLVTAGNGGLFRNFEILELQGTVAAAASGALDAALLTNSTITGQHWQPRLVHGQQHSWHRTDGWCKRVEHGCWERGRYACELDRNCRYRSHHLRRYERIQHFRCRVEQVHHDGYRECLSCVRWYLGLGLSHAFQFVGYV
jgi:hypothetical protein